VRVTETTLPGVLIVEAPLFRDERGFFLEAWREDRFAEAGVPDRFVQDNQSRSVKGTLRGLHWQWRKPQAKLVRVLAGRIFDVVVDVRRGSPSFGRWFGLEMSAEEFTSLYVPAGYAHGFCVLSETADFVYKCTNYYDGATESGIRFDDPDVGIEWPTGFELLYSQRDREAPRLADVADSLPFTV